MKNFKILALVVGVGYPLIVYFFKDVIDNQFAFLLLLLFLLIRIFLGLEMALFKNLGKLNLAFIIPMLFVIAVLYLFVPTALKFMYPVMMNLQFAYLFFISLRTDMPLIERFARQFGKMPIDEEAIRYMRSLTKVWGVFCTCNGVASFIMAWMCSLEMWSLYNSVVSYGLMGLLGGIEYIYRRYVMKKKAALKVGLGGDAS